MALVESVRLGDFSCARRVANGYFDATSMCRGAKWDKQANDWRRLGRTQALVDSLATDLGVHPSTLIQTVMTGPNEERGTWIHPDLALSLAMWLDQMFGVCLMRYLKNSSVQSAPARAEHVPLAIDWKERYNMLGEIEERMRRLQNGSLEERDRIFLSDQTRVVAHRICGDLAAPENQSEKTEEVLVTDVCRRLGLPTDDKFIQAVGLHVSNLYLKRHGHRPSKCDRWVGGGHIKANYLTTADEDLIEQGARAAAATHQQPHKKRKLTNDPMQPKLSF